MAQKFKAEVEWDAARGVLYVHLTERVGVEYFQAPTIVRICRLPEDFQSIDVTNGHGYSVETKRG